MSSSSSSFRASSADEVRLAGSATLDEEDNYSDDGPPPSSQQFDSGRYEPTGDEIFSSQPMTTEARDSPPSEFSSGGGFSPEKSGNGPILPPPDEMLTEEGFALREWRRQNVIRLEEKEKREKEVLHEIIKEAEDYKAEHYSKWKLRCENNRAANREREKLFLATQEKFHAEVSKSYWKAIGELIPKEVPNIEKRGKKDKEKKPSITVIQGPKPGKPTDLSRMRQILVKLKHNPPPHMEPPPPLSVETGKDGKAVKTSPANSASGRAAKASSATAK